MTLNKQNIFNSLILTLYFRGSLQQLINQRHGSARRDNSVRTGTEEDPGWGVPAHISVTKRAKNVDTGA